MNRYRSGNKPQRAPAPRPETDGDVQDASAGSMTDFAAKAREARVPQVAKRAQQVKNQLDHFKRKDLFQS